MGGIRKKKTARVKLLVVGDAFSGKTALLKAICKAPFVANYSPTVFESMITKVKIGKKEIEFQLWDTTGDELHDRFGNLSYAGSDVVLACFAINNPKSIVTIAERWAPKIRHHCPRTPLILVGCKSDLRRPWHYDSTSDGDSGNDSDLKLELLNPNEGYAMATRLGAYLYLETSAKTKYGIDALITLAGKVALERKSHICKIL